MVDFKYMMTEEYKQKRAKEKKLEKQIQEIKDKTCCFTGHRPQALWGYDITIENYIKLAKLIKIECIRLIEDKGVNRFITGGALGIDTIAFLVVYKLKKEYPDIQNILSIPFKNQAIKWFNQTDVDRYNKMKEHADEIVYVDLLDKYKVKGIADDVYHPAKMQKRNEYMVDNSGHVIAVWNGDKKGGTWNCVKYAKNNCNEITRIDPRYFEISYNLQFLL
jgi:Uncharacterized protein conserved in bacteria